MGGTAVTGGDHSGTPTTRSPLSPRREGPVSPRKSPRSPRREGYQPLEILVRVRENLCKIDH